jgi:uncharacterized membrane protein YbaN (DUF454 family)
MIRTLMLRPAQLLLWRIFALIALAIGAVGIVLPVLPTVPFWILAAWAAGKGWPSLQQWLINHPKYGASIRGWQERGTVSRKAKWLATTTMLISAAALQFTSALPWLKIAVPIAMLGVAVWLWRRPE